MATAGGVAATTAGVGGDGGVGTAVCGATRDGSPEAALASFAGAAFAGGEGAATIGVGADGAAGVDLTTSAGGSLFAGLTLFRSGDAEELRADEVEGSTPLPGFATGA